MSQAGANAGKTLDADRPDSVRMSAEEAAVVGMRALKALGYSEEDAKIVVDQLIDNGSATTANARSGGTVHHWSAT